MMPVPISDNNDVLHRYTHFRFPPGIERTVDVWLPPGAAQTTGHRYAVVYMHDGQNLFDPALAYTGVDWGMDEAVQRLMADGFAGAIVVGIWNSGNERWLDYFPQKLLHGPQAQGVIARYGRQYTDLIRSDGYLRFLVNELKPFIDHNYPTLPDASHTVVMGSSMGGLISLYALEQYPHVFGAAGCLSTHWPAGDDALVDLLAADLPAPGAHRLYFDYGTAGLDAQYEPFQQSMDAHLRAARYRASADWLTRKFDGAEHNEASWRARVEEPLKFLLKI